MSVGGVCMVGFFSTRGDDDDSGSSIPEFNITKVNSSVGTAASQDSDTNNTALGLMVRTLNTVVY